MDAWRYADVRDHWDEIELHAWNTRDGERNRYQDSTLAEILPAGEILDIFRERQDTSLDGAAVLSGTVPTVSGELSPGSRFEVELHHPVLDRSLSVGYDVTVLYGAPAIVAGIPSSARTANIGVLGARGRGYLSRFRPLSVGGGAQPRETTV